MNNSYDVVVVGGGIVGLSAAISMRQQDLSVAVIDSGTLTCNQNEPDVRVYAINQASQSLFQVLGVWQLLDKTRLSPYTHMQVWDASNKAQIDFDARMVGTDQLGTIIEECVIKAGLLQKASMCGVDFFPESRVTAVQTGIGGVEVSCGMHNLQAKLLIVADGAASATRDLLGVAITSWPYHQRAIVASVQTEIPHQGIAYQVFNPDGPLAFLPMKHATHCSIVWSTTPSRAKSLMSLPDDAFNQQLTTAFASTLGLSQVISTRHCFPLHMSHTQQYVGKNWLLMGDAAHRIHPLAGLGLNVGLADVAAWLAKVDAAKSPAWSNKVLSSYQRERKHAVWQIIVAMGGLKSLFINPIPPVVALRGLGLRACNKIPALKRFFIEQAQ